MVRGRWRRAGPDGAGGWGVGPATTPPPGPDGGGTGRGGAVVARGGRVMMPGPDGGDGDGGGAGWDAAVRGRTAATAVA
ncbi:hypothetical protein TPA0910_31790 [Streptomyces hygroscopicus subsp. sporocinereus]|uniref:Uncharacterized protein n=1 Tax=Streptomyces hygroscopicus TaxID=1912 RepID=A0ABQ3U0H4_STRHY|nr:hypothetical protein TPA0910_31790 [Streptomyces hygroscopicus]